MRQYPKRIVFRSRTVDVILNVGCVHYYVIPAVRLSVEVPGTIIRSVPEVIYARSAVEFPSPGAAVYGEIYVRARYVNREVTLIHYVSAYVHDILAWRDTLLVFRSVRPGHVRVKGPQNSHVVWIGNSAVIAFVVIPYGRPPVLPAGVVGTGGVEVIDNVPRRIGLVPAIEKVIPCRPCALRDVEGYVRGILGRNPFRRFPARGVVCV